jgi:hypothetical protein
MTPSPSARLFTPAFITLTLSELAYFTAAGLIIGLTPFCVRSPAACQTVAAAVRCSSAGRWSSRS